MHDPTTVADLQREVGELEQRLLHQKETARRRSRISILLVSLVCVTLLGFVAFNYWYLRSEWTQEAFQASLQMELGDMAPVARNELDQLGREVVPVYIEEGRNQFQARWPELAADLRAQAEQVRTESALHCRETLHGTENRIIRQVEGDVLAGLANVTDAAERERLQRDFEHTTEVAVADAVDRFHARFEQRLVRTRDSIAGFDSNRDLSSVDLNKRFVQLWLELLEDEILAQ